MEFRLSEEQEMMVAAVRRMVEREIQPVLDAHPRDRAMPKSAFQKLFKAAAAMGLTGPRVPESAGGSGLAMLDYGMMFEQIPVAVSMSYISMDACIERLHNDCNPEQRERFLPALLAGDKIGCTSTTEPDSGSDTRGLKTRIRRDGNHFVINGRKSFITNVSVSDLTIVTGRMEGTDEIVKLVVERDASPYEAQELDAIGLQQGLWGEVLFDEVRVPVENLLVPPHSGLQTLAVSWNVNRPLVGLQAVHIAQKAYEQAKEFAMVRHQFGGPLAGHQLMQKRLSDMEMLVTGSRLMCYNALAAVDQGARANGTSAMAKKFAITYCEQAVLNAMHVMGSMGLTREAGIEQHYRDIRMLTPPDATEEILTLIHGREITGIAAFRQ